MSYHYIIAISSTECVYVPRQAQACLREPQEPCVKGGTWWCVTPTLVERSLAALHMTGRANGGWKALKCLHSGEAGLQQLVKKPRRRKHFQLCYVTVLRRRSYRVQLLWQISAAFTLNLPPTCLCADGHCDIMLSHYYCTTVVLLAPHFNTHTSKQEVCHHWHNEVHWKRKMEMTFTHFHLQMLMSASIKQYFLNFNRNIVIAHLMYPNIRLNLSAFNPSDEQYVKVTSLRNG